MSIGKTDICLAYHSENKVSYDWNKGRIALVSDAGYCVSPAAGRSGSLAIDGTAALADAFEQSNFRKMLSIITSMHWYQKMMK